MMLVGVKSRLNHFAARCLLGDGSNRISQGESNASITSADNCSLNFWTSDVQKFEERLYNLGR